MSRSAKYLVTLFLRHKQDHHFGPLFHFDTTYAPLRRSIGTALPCIAKTPVASEIAADLPGRGADPARFLLAVVLRRRPFGIAVAVVIFAAIAGFHLPLVPTMLIAAPISIFLMMRVGA